MAVDIVKNTIKDRDERKFAVMLSRTTREAGIVLQSFVVPLVPVDTGRLRASIRSRSRKDGDGYLAIVGTNVEYAPFVEYRQSYMRLGLDIGRATIQKLFDDRIAQHFKAGV
jgi:hypothetical protein